MCKCMCTYDNMLRCRQSTLAPTGLRTRVARHLPDDGRIKPRGFFEKYWPTVSVPIKKIADKRASVSCVSPLEKPMCALAVQGSPLMIPHHSVPEWDRSSC